MERLPITVCYGGGGGGLITKINTDWVNLCLDVLKTEIQETVENKPVFDPDFHTELIIKDEFENLDSGNLDFCKTRNSEIISIKTFRIKN